MVVLGGGVVPDVWCGFEGDRDSGVRGGGRSGLECGAVCEGAGRERGVSPGPAAGSRFDGNADMVSGGRLVLCSGSHNATSLRLVLKKKKKNRNGKSRALLVHGQTTSQPSPKKIAVWPSFFAPQEA